jgi:hypothetical protein
MKLRNREVNVFSMSALDLFASGMGAFILLAVISMPFFGNVSKTPTEGPLQCPKPKVCPVEKVCEVCPPPSPPGFQKMATLDLVIVLDITGSMDKEIAGLKSEINNIAALLERLSENAAIRIVVFGDDDFDRPVTAFPLTPTINVSTLQDQLKLVEMNIGMGKGDNGLVGEAVYPGFEQAMLTKWRSAAERSVVVIITDDGAHSGDDNRLLSAVNSFAGGNKGKSVSVRYSGTDTSEADFYQKVASAGNGTFMDNSNGSLTAALFLALLPK